MMLKWNVYCENNQKIEVYDIFNHTHFVKDLVEMFKKIKKEDKKYREEHGYGMSNYKWSNKDENKAINFIEDFSDKKLNFICMYQFSSRCEYELILTDWPPSIDRKEIYRLVNEDKRHVKEWGEPAYKYSPNLCINEKIDIYNQLKLNWNIFKKYIFDNEKEIKKLHKSRGEK